MLRRGLPLRFFLTFVVLIAFFAVLLGRLASLHLVDNKQLSKKAKGQYKFFLRLSPWRGTIYDRNGKRLAVSIPTESVFVRPEEVDSPMETAAKIAPILEKDPSCIYQGLTSKGHFVWLERKVSADTAQRLRSLGLKGIGFEEERKRVYPRGSLCSHILGFAGIDNDGLEGVELLFDEFLKGTHGYISSEKDARRREVVARREKFLPSKEGNSIILTLDEVIQNIVEEELDKHFSVGGVDRSKTRCLGVTAIVMQPFTGEILALSNRPTFDPNDIGNSLPSERRNRAVTDIFEPGSCFKIVAAAGALEEGIFSLQDKIFCEKGAFRVCGHTIHDTHSYNRLTFQETVEKSSNIGFAKIGRAIGEKKFYGYIRGFGFGGLSGIDLPGEVVGLIRPPNRWSGLSLSILPFGQEIAVTGIQLTCAMGVVANGGVLVQPRVVKKIISPGGEVVKSFDVCRKRRVISERSASELTKALVGVVKRGTGKRAQIPGYSVAGKTGTAQKVINGVYSHGKFFSSFIGFAPSENPRIAVLIAVDEPRDRLGRYYGGTIAAPVFREITKKALNYLGVMPSAPGREKKKSYASAVPKKRSADDSSAYFSGEGFFLEGAVMPDVSGCSMREAINRLRQYQLIVQIDGKGFVVKQEPRAGTAIKPNSACRIMFSPNL